MIKNFDKETAPLDSYEMYTLLPVLVRCLSVKNGRVNAVSSGHICRCMNEAGYKLSDARLRKLINHIRNNDLILGLMATSEGYYIAETEQELQDYEESLRGRIEAIESIRRAIVRQKNMMFQPQQLSLFG